ncbi:MAG: methyltransferase domain-containing protein, partial [Candidatus Gastranaerophilaceae bacterium]
MDDLSDLFSLPSTLDILECTLKTKFHTILDVGYGKGGANVFYTYHGKDVTSIGIGDEKRPDFKEAIKKYNLKPPINTTLEDFNPNVKYDAMLISHVLEHVMNPGIFLNKAHDLLKDEGWLFIMVPYYNSKIASDHIYTGWNLGSLMYILLRTGFNIKDGHFIKYSENICGFVKKIPNWSETSIEQWPIDVFGGCEGDLDEINWFKDFNRRFDNETLNLNFEKTNKNIVEYSEKLKQKEIYLYGAGKIAEKIFQNCSNLDKLNIKGFIDRDINKKGKLFFGYPVYHYDQIKELSPEVLILFISFT